MYIIQKQLHEHHEISRLFPNVSIAGIHYFWYDANAYAHTRDSNNNNDNNVDDNGHDDGDDDNDKREKLQRQNGPKLL